MSNAKFERKKKYENIRRKIQGLSINNRYDMKYSELTKIFETARIGLSDAIANSFRLGYLNGYKACKAELKKRSA